MDASARAGDFCMVAFWKGGGLVSGLLVQGVLLLVLMEFADEVLI
jgi:hypothetical protein